MYFAPLLLALPQINNGKLVPLVISGSKRSALLPDVTTIAEAGNPDHTTPAVTVPVHSGATSSQGSVYRPHRIIQRRSSYWLAGGVAAGERGGNGPYPRKGMLGPIPEVVGCGS